tara:strand:+ start:28 stop:615 length:588 start_codon:yes stop_codon:yes gene_type:complete
MPVKIHGKDYKTVAERVTEFHNDHKDKKSIITEIIQFKDGIVVVKAVIKIAEDVFCGHAYEDIGSSPINTTSALENCETSAIGRALASAGYLGSEFASADELVTALNKQNTPYKAKKEDLSGDGWRDKPIGFKSGKNEGKSYREVDDETLIWIVEQCKVEAWKEKATKEINIRSGKVEEESKPKVSKEDADSLFE